MTDDKERRIAELEAEVDDKDRRIAELEAEVKEQTYQAFATGTILTMTIREPGSQLPALNAAVERRLSRLAFDLERVAGRSEVATILATAVGAAPKETRDHAAQWMAQSARLAKELQAPHSDEPASVQRNHPDTSWEAAELVLPSRETDWWTILRMFEEQARAGSNEGYTSYEVGKIIDPERSTSTATSRLGELEGKNRKVNFGRWLEVRKGARRHTRGHSTARVFQLTMVAREKMGLLTGPTLPGFDPPLGESGPLFQ